MPSATPIDFTESDLPKNLSKAEHARLLTYLKPCSPAHPDTQIDASAMLQSITDRKFSTSDRIRTLFVKNNFSPIAKLLKLCKIEEAKMDAWNLAIEARLDPKLMEFLPRPDKKFYATLLMSLAKYEGPELKSVELTGEIQAGIKVTIMKHVPQQRIVRVDEKSPNKLKLLYGAVPALVEKAKEVAVEIVDDI